MKNNLVAALLVFCFVSVGSSDTNSLTNKYFDSISKYNRCFFKKEISHFNGSPSTAMFYYDDSLEGSDSHPVNAIGFIKMNGKILAKLSNYEWEGGAAEISDVFESPEKSNPELLFVIAKWFVSHRGLGINGYNYQVKVYSNRVKSDSNGIMQFAVNDSLSNLFGLGFEGTNEDGKIESYNYRDKESVYKKLYSKSHNQSPSPQSCHQALKSSYKNVSTKMDCAIDIANSINEGLLTISHQSVSTFNDIGYFLEERKLSDPAIQILEKVVAFDPSRTVAYINLADAYWDSGKKEQAKQKYLEYVKMMRNSGKEKKIPQKVLERTNSK